MKTVAAILAGGSGKRFGGEIPKQFVKVNGKTIIEYTLDAFGINTQIDEICVVVNPNYMDIMEDIGKKGPYKKVKSVICGGRERYDSSLAAINFYEGRDVNILIHDGARPNVSQKIITDASKSLADFKAVCTAVPSTDTIAVASEDKTQIREIPKRAYMYQVQTPQGFYIETIKEAYKRAMEDPLFFATDDCGVVKKYMPEVKIKIIEGSPDNIKITHTDDLKYLRLE